MKAKRQAPTSKLQRNSKHQHPKSAKSRRVGFEYSDAADKTWVLKEESPDREQAPKHPFDLEERTARFGETMVRFSRSSNVQNNIRRSRRGGPMIWKFGLRDSLDVGDWSLVVSNRSSSNTAR
ncbi:MAG: hypothetical protein DME33_13270 [Verrucomicrobia bacterium]|nr:MAG: hypothetical protein DME33_13270 [Verrucomicrobiota bacterium]